MMTIEEFIEECQKRPIPNNRMERVRVFVEELVEGVLEGVWEHQINLKPYNSNFSEYKRVRWKSDKLPPLAVVEILQYIQLSEHKDKFDRDQYFLTLTSAAFDFIDKRQREKPQISINIFISYKRSESSAYALLVERELKQAGLTPFLDKQLQVGDDWHDKLEQNIKDSDYFIILLGNKTLESSVTVKEIQWALDGNIPIIPIWHNEFEFRAHEWTQLSGAVSQALANTHTIRVLEENPLTYDTALRELLNRFGIST